MGSFIVILSRIRKGVVSGGSTPTPPDSHLSSRLIDDSSSHLLDDDGNYLIDIDQFLLEDGDRLLLEDGISLFVLE